MKRKYPFFHNGQKPSSSYGSSMLHQAGAYANRGAPTTLMNPRNDTIVSQLIMRNKNTLPFKNVTQIMRKCLPPKIKISNGAKKLVQICCSKFINKITKKANERCKSESKIILGADEILWAMDTLGYNNYFYSLNLYLKRYRYSNEIDVGPSSSMNPNPMIEMVEAIDMDKFWDGVDNLDVGSSGTASRNFDPFTEVNFDDI